MSAHIWKIALVVTMTHAFRELSRRFGPRWGGLALGLPCSTAVALAGVGCEQGVEDAVSMAGGCQLGLAGAVAVPLAYGFSIARGARPGGALAASVGAFLLVAAAAGQFDPSAGGAGLGISAAAVLAAAGLMGRVPSPGGDGSRGDRSPATARTLALRTLIPAACLSASMAIGRGFGPGGGGLMMAFPGLTLTVLGLTHLEAGPSAAIRMARALPVGNLGMVAFLAAFRLGCRHQGLAGGLALGYLATLGILGLLVMPEARWAAIRARVAAWSEWAAPVARRPGLSEWADPAWPRPGRRFSPIFETVAH